MGTTLIRSKAALNPTAGQYAVATIADGAVLQEDGVIAALGTYEDLHRRYPGTPVIGTGNEVLLPGFVNAHHHVGLTPVQLGSPDMPLELWFVTRMVARNLNLYLDTLYSAFEMVGSGITAVQHIHGWLPGTPAEVEARANDVLRAYDEIGMRVSYCYAVRDQNRLAYQADAELVASLPPELRGPMQAWFDRFKMSLDGAMDMFASMHSAQAGRERVRVQLAPANLHWCSDDALGRLASASERHQVPLHMHLVETALQKEYARRRGGGTAAEPPRRAAPVRSRRPRRRRGRENATPRLAPKSRPRDGSRDSGADQSLRWGRATGLGRRDGPSPDRAGRPRSGGGRPGAPLWGGGPAVGADRGSAWGRWPDRATHRPDSRARCRPCGPALVHPRRAVGAENRSRPRRQAKEKRLWPW